MHDAPKLQECPVQMQMLAWHPSSGHEVLTFGSAAWVGQWEISGFQSQKPIGTGKQMLTVGRALIFSVPTGEKARIASVFSLVLPGCGTLCCFK